MKRKFEFWNKLMDRGDGSCRSEGKRLKVGDDYVLIFNIWEEDEWSIGVKLGKQGRVSLKEKDLLLLLERLADKSFCVGG